MILKLAIKEYQDNMEHKQCRCQVHDSLSKVEEIATMFLFSLLKGIY
jgi:hypothetical protein